MLFQYNESIVNDVFLRHITSSQRTLLLKQGIKDGRDLLLLRPKRYDLRRYDISLNNLALNTEYSLIGKIRSVSRRVVRKNLTVFSAMLLTKNDHIPLIWFNQKYVIDKLKHDPFVVVHGKLDECSDLCSKRI